VNQAAGQTTRRPTDSLSAMVSGFFRATEINSRLLGMLLALIVILVVFHLLSGGTFLHPANMGTLAVQMSGTAIVATGMVLVIVSRNIDLSVGSQVGIAAMLYALLMADWMPALLGIELGDPFGWLIALAIGLTVGVLIGGVQGFIISYIGVPSFVVTLGGLLAFRGVVWQMSSGAAVSGIDETFRKLGGGYRGSVGGDTTWILAVLVCIAIVAFLVYNRWQRKRFDFKQRPIWAEVLLGSLGIVVVLGLAWFANQAYWPSGAAERFAAQNDISIPEGGLLIPIGFPWPVLLMIGVAVVMTIFATRRRFGRYVYAYGGNPEAAALAGINTRWVVMKTFIVIGVLCSLAGGVASARLNGATLDIGFQEELDVIAAAVVGGASFAGGIGTIPGAILGAAVMTSLRFGLAYQGFNASQQNIVIGIVLVVAVGFDSWNRRRGGGS
jgi:D-xylose transport system permease protein